MALTDNPIYLIGVLALILYLSYRFSQKEPFASFGLALLAIVFGALFSNLGVIPSGPNPTYDVIFEIIAPVALFLLLLDANLGQLRNTGMPLLILFLSGSLGTVVGVVAAMRWIGDDPLFEGVYAALGGMFAGTYTGGSINFNAVALEYGVPGKGVLYTSSVAVDNVLTAIWFFATITLPVVLNRIFPRKRGQRVSFSPDSSGVNMPSVSEESEQLTIGSLSLWIVISAASLLLSEQITRQLGQLGYHVPFMIVITSIALGLAQIPAIHRLRGNRFLGSWSVYLFLAVIGAYCDFFAMITAGKLALLMLAIVFVTVVLHGLIIFGITGLLGYDWYLAAIASQANIGGGTSAMALAKNFGRSDLILPAIIIGSLGNALGTYLGFLVAGIL